VASLVIHELAVVVLGAIGLVVHSLAIADAAERVGVARAITLVLLLFATNKSVSKSHQTELHERQGKSAEGFASVACHDVNSKIETPDPALK